MTFEPLYPHRLRCAVSHAESLCILLSRLGARRGDLTARAWLTGRRQEVACFVQQVGRDYRSKKLDETAATTAVDAYLAALHAGLRTHFGVRSPACCQASVAITIVASPFADDDPTTVYVRRPESRLPSPPRLTRSVRPASVTWLEVEPNELVAGLAVPVQDSWRSTASENPRAATPL